MREHPLTKHLHSGPFVLAAPSTLTTQFMTANEMRRLLTERLLLSYAHRHGPNETG